MEAQVTLVVRVLAVGTAAVPLSSGLQHGEAREARLRVEYLNDLAEAMRLKKSFDAFHGSLLLGFAFE
jgi:hypothetical protein